jgi:hypothetical protein
LYGLAWPGELVLVVRDNGDGFDVQKDTTKAGLGLISMRERVVLVGGQFAIDSKPGVGTTVRVRVPLAAIPLYRFSEFSSPHGELILTQSSLKHDSKRPERHGRRRC